MLCLERNNFSYSTKDKVTWAGEKRKTMVMLTITCVTNIYDISKIYHLKWLIDKLLKVV